MLEGSWHLTSPSLALATKYFKALQLHGKHNYSLCDWQCQSALNLYRVSMQILVHSHLTICCLYEGELYNKSAVSDQCQAKTPDTYKKLLDQFEDTVWWIFLSRSCNCSMLPITIQWYRSSVMIVATEISWHYRKVYYKGFLFKENVLPGLPPKNL